MVDPFPFADEFPALAYQDWRKLVEAALKGASFDKRLTSQTYDGLRIEPLYPRAVGASAVVGRGAAGWEVVSRVDLPKPKAANAALLNEIENGATGVSLVFAGAPGARGFGLSVDTADELDQTLSGVALDAIALRVETAPFGGRSMVTQLTDVADRRKVNAAGLAIDFGLDPIGDMARTGHTLLPWPKLAERAGETAAVLKADGFSNARFLRADGRAVHEAGGSEGQELGFVLAAAVAYLRLLEASGFALEDARRRISFLLAADADEFLSIAKFRALRKLWARVEEACGLTPVPTFVAAETAWRMMTARDAYVNMLRTTIAVTAAGLGGADAITTLPFTLALGLPDRFARRVARNMQLTLLEESNLYRVADPAAGSGGIEALTTEVAKAAWSLFQEIEAAGGAAAALSAGLIQKKVAATRAARQKAVALRKDAITGVSDYPNLTEAPVNVLDVARTPITPLPANFEALPSLRLSEPFEALRDRSDAVLAQTGARPKVFLATLGRPSDFNARATFARNFYEAGGIEVVTFLPSPLAGEGGEERKARRAGRGVNATETPHPAASQPASPARGEVKEEVVAAFKTSGARLACLCSSDDVYALEAEMAAKALVAAGAIVHLAGRPSEHEKDWRKAGVTTFLFVGCDVLSTLRAVHDKLAAP